MFKKHDETDSGDEESDDNIGQFTQPSGPIIEPRWWLLVVLYALIAFWWLVLKIVLIATAIGVALTLAWPFVLAAFWQYVQGFVDSVQGRIVAVIVLTAIAAGLYFIKTRLLKFYGLAEAGIGVAACWVGFSQIGVSAMTLSLTLAGGVYLIVSGVENYFEGKRA